MTFFFFFALSFHVKGFFPVVTSQRRQREVVSVMLAALWRSSRKLKALFRGSNIANKLLVSNPARPRFLPPPSTFLRRAAPLVSAPLSTAAALAVNPSSNSSPLCNAAAKGLGSAHVSLPYRLWAGSTQSCHILPTFPLQQAPFPTSLPCTPHTLQTSPYVSMHRPPFFTRLHLWAASTQTQREIWHTCSSGTRPGASPCTCLRLAPRADVMSDNRSSLSAHSGFISREGGCQWEDESLSPAAFPSTQEMRKAKILQQKTGNGNI